MQKLNRLLVLRLLSSTKLSFPKLPPHSLPKPLFPSQIPSKPFSSSPNLYDEALHLFQQGKPTDSLRKLQAILRENQSTGLYQETIISILNFMAGIYKDLGKTDQALDVYIQGLEKSLQLNGENHPQTLSFLTSISALHEGKNPHKEEFRFEEQDSAPPSPQNTSKSPENSLKDLAESYENAGYVLMLKEKDEHALDCFEQSLKIRSELEEPKAFATIHGLMARAVLKFFRYEECKDHLDQRLEIQRNIYRENHPSYITTYHILGDYYDTALETKLAIESYEKALDLYRENGLEEDITAGNIHGSLGKIYSAWEEHEKAEPHLLSAYKIKEKELPRDHPQLVWVCERLCKVYEESNRVDEALKWYLRVLQGNKRLYGEDDMSNQYIIDHIIGLYLKQGNIEKANSYLLQCLRILEKTGASPANFLRKWADILRRQGNLEQARELLVTIREFFEHHQEWKGEIEGDLKRIQAEIERKGK